MTDDEAKEVAKMSVDLMNANLEIERLRNLLSEAATDLSSYVDHEYQSRHQYPDEMRRWKRDMVLVDQIKAAIREQTND